MANHGCTRARTSRSADLVETVPLVAALVIIVAGAAAGVYFYNSSWPSPQNVTSDCHDPGSIGAHVYNPWRLTLVKQCITVSGTVDRVIQEADGDYHVRLHLDVSYSNLTNEANNTYQYGDLVVEIICAGPVTQQDAVLPCDNYTNNIPIPTPTQHIVVSGPYVLDSEHHNWAEIHPVYSLTIS